MNNSGVTLKTGMSISLKGEDDLEMRTKIFSVGEGEICLYDNMPSEVRPGAKLDAYSSTVSGLIHLTLNFLGNDVIDDILVSYFKWSGDITLLQRREVFRLYAIFDVEVQTMDGKRFRAQGKDLSEGGLRFETRHFISDTESLFVRFILEGTEYRLPVVIRRRVTVAEGKEPLYGYGCSFEDIGVADLKMLRRYIFKSQLKGRRL